MHRQQPHFRPAARRRGPRKCSRGTVDSTHYTHYSSLSTVEANWGLGSLGRGDTNKTLSNVYTNFTATSTPTPVNLTAQNETVPWTGPRVAASTNSTSSSGNGAAGGGHRGR